MLLFWLSKSLNYKEKIQKSKISGEHWACFPIWAENSKKSRKFIEGNKFLGYLSTYSIQLYWENRY